MMWDTPDIKKSEVKIWVPGHISIFQFYERFYEPNIGTVDGRRVELGKLPKGCAISIAQKHSIIRDWIYEIEDEGFCALPECESVFRVVTGYYPIRKKRFLS
jgi:hypothetical protein